MAQLSTPNNSSNNNLSSFGSGNKANSPIDNIPSNIRGEVKRTMSEGTAQALFGSSFSLFDSNTSPTNSGILSLKPPAINLANSQLPPSGAKKSLTPPRSSGSFPVTTSSSSTSAFSSSYASALKVGSPTDDVGASSYHFGPESPGHDHIHSFLLNDMNRDREREERERDHLEAFTGRQGRAYSEPIRFDSALAYSHDLFDLSSLNIGGGGRREGLNIGFNNSNTVISSSSNSNSNIADRGDRSNSLSSAGDRVGINGVLSSDSLNNYGGSVGIGGNDRYERPMSGSWITGGSPPPVVPSNSLDLSNHSSYTNLNMLAATFPPMAPPPNADFSGTRHRSLSLNAGLTGLTSRSPGIIGSNSDSYLSGNSATTLHHSPSADRLQQLSYNNSMSLNEIKGSLFNSNPSRGDTRESFGGEAIIPVDPSVVPTSGRTLLNGILGENKSVWGNIGSPMKPSPGGSSGGFGGDRNVFSLQENDSDFNDNRRDYSQHNETGPQRRHSHPILPSGDIFETGGISKFGGMGGLGLGERSDPIISSWSTMNRR
jgi:hypothetical protein